MRKKSVLLRVMGIGLFHCFLYLWLVPFVIYPRFGDNGFILAVAVAILVSAGVIGTLFLGRASGRNNKSNS